MEWKTAEEFAAALAAREAGQAESAVGSLEHEFATAARVLDTDPAARTVTLQYHFLPSMGNAWGGGHGGAQAMMLDHAMAAVIRNMLGHDLTPTVDLQLHYLRTARMEEPYHIRVKMERPGRSLVVMSAVSWGADPEKPCTIATGTYVLK